MSPVILRSQTSPGRHAARMAALIIVLAGLTGCAAGNPDDTAVTAGSSSAPLPATSDIETVQPSPAVDGEASDVPPVSDGPTDDAAALQQTINDALTDLAASSPQPSREQLRDALTAAGIATDRLEISASTTPTGLNADAIQAGVVSESVCLMSYIRDGAVTSSVLPLLTNGQCFLGSDHG